MQRGFGARLALGLATLSCALLAACGGGGGGGGATPPPAPAITVANGGTVTSGDGKVQLVVDPSTASAAASPTIAKSAPDATVAAAASYVADSTYQYTGPDLTFSADAAWNLTSTSAQGGKRIVIAATDSRPQASVTTLTPFCDRLYAQQHGITAHQIWSRDPCPSGCDEAYQLANGLRSCMPRDPYFFVVPIAQQCPAGSTDVSGTPGLPLTNAWRYCEFGGGNASPVIATVPSQPLGGCNIASGQFLCKIKAITANSPISVFKDTEPPLAAVVTLFANGDPDVKNFPSNDSASGTVKVPAGGSHPFTLLWSVQATNEPVGLRQVELRELTSLSFANNTLDLSSAVIDSEVPQGQSLPAGTKQVLLRQSTVVYADANPAVRWFFVRAIDWSGNVRLSNIMRVVKASPTGPVVTSFTATPAALPATGGSTTLNWVLTDATSASIDNGVGAVSATTGSVTVPLTTTTTFTLTATNAVGSATSTTTVTVSADTTPPSVTLSASSQNVVAPGSTTLTATANDNLGVTKVEFYEGASLLVTKTAAPYTHDIAFTTAGSHAYTARAYDAANNAATSTAVTVLVTLPSSADRFVSNATGLDTNDGLTAATAYKTVTKALSTVASGGTVWLANGTYPPENAGPPNPSYLAVVPAGITVRATVDGGASLGFGLQYPNGGSAIGLAFAGANVRADVTGIDALGGTVALSKLSFTNLGGAISNGGGFNANAGIKTHGTAVVTLDAGPGNPVVFGGGVENAVLAYEGGKLTLTGGTILSSGSCSSDTCVSQFRVGGTADVVVDGTVVTLGNSGEPLPQPWLLLQDSAKMTVRNSTLSQAGPNAEYHGLARVADTSSLLLQDSAMTGTWRYIAQSNGGSPSVIARGLNMQATLRAGGLLSTVGTPSFTVDGNSQFSGIAVVNNPNIAVVELTSGGTVTIDHAAFANNRLGVHTTGAFPYNVRVRNSTFTGNATCAQPSCYTFSLAGDATSVFDLGTAADPGNNTITAASTGTGVLVNANAAVAVNAVGNTWVGGAQGANGTGNYTLGAAPCGPSTCNVTTGSGRNYVIQTGTLKLAGQ